MKISKKFISLSAVVLLLFSTACVETVVVSSIVGGAIVVRQKNLKHTKDDVLIATKMGSEFLAEGLKNPGNSIDITVNEGRVLLTGIVRDPNKAKHAQDIAWKVAGVKEVIDEIQIREYENIKMGDVSSASRDYAITAEVESKLLFARDISSLNYQVTTVDGTVYLLGVADNEIEMRRVISIVSKIRGVTKVVNHVILEDDSRRKG